MSANWVQIIKKIAKEEREASKPCDLVYGEVKSVKPLEIAREQKFVLSEDFLLLTKNVLDYETEITINDGTKQKCIIHNGLKKGDKVLMLRKPGGQLFIILDKV